MYEKFFGKIITVGGSKGVVIPKKIMDGLNWDDETELIVMVKKNR